MGNGTTKLSPAQVDDFKGITDFTEEEIMDWYKNFLKNNNNGRMTPEGIQEMYKVLFPYGNPEKFSDHVFRMVDVDNDGTVDFREYLTLLSTVLKGDPDARLRRAFMLYDVNGDGTISAKELATICKSLTCTQRMLMSEKEQEASAERMIRVFDKDNNGGLSFDEFVNMSKNIPAIVNSIYAEADFKKME